MEQLREVRKQLSLQLQSTDKKVSEHWERLLDSAEPAHIMAKAAKNIFDFVSQAAMVERIYRTIQSFVNMMFSDENSKTEKRETV